jgi:hypothetical protein
VWPTLKNKHEIRNFLGLRTYYRRVISVFANIAKTLPKVTEEYQTSQWTPEVEAAIQGLKEVICTAPILAFPHPKEAYR